MKKTNSLYLILFILFLSQTANALDYFWVGGSGMWSDHQNHWATSSGGSTFHDQVPTSMDNVYFDANSFPTPGGIVTIDQTIIYCMDMDWTGATGTPVLQGPEDKQVWIFGSLKLVPDMEWEVTGEVHFRAFEVGKAIKLSGKVIDGPVYFEGLGEWEFQDDFTVTRDMEQKSGSIRTLGNKVSVGKLLATSGSLYLYDSEVYIKKGRYYSRSEFLDAGTSHIIFTDSQSELNGSSIAPHHTFYRVTFNNFLGRVSHCNIASKVEYKIGSGVYRGSVGNYVKSIEFDGFGKVEGDGIEFDTATFHSNGEFMGSNIFGVLKLSPGYLYQFWSGTINTIKSGGVLEASGTSCTNRTTFISNKIGELAKINTSGADFTFNDLIVMDIYIEGGGEITAINSIDLGGNYGWNILSPLSRNLYWVGGGGNWNDEQNWSLVSGGIGGECIPSAYDNVFFDENSGFLTSGEIVFVNDERIYCNNMTWQGVENEPAFNSTLSSSINKLLIYGSFSLDSFMSIYFIGSIHFRAFEVGKAIKLSGKVIDGPVYFEGLGEWEFQDDFTVTRDMEQKSGSIRTLGNKVSVGKLLATSGSLYLYDSEVYIKKGRYYSRSEFLDAGTSHIIFTDSQSELNGSSIAPHHTFYRVTFNNFLGRVSHCNIASKVEYKIGSGVYRGSVGNYVKSIEFDGFGKVEGDGIEFDTATFHSNGEFMGSNIFGVLKLSPGYLYQFWSGTINTIKSGGVLEASGTSCTNRTTFISNKIGELAKINTSGADFTFNDLIVMDIYIEGGGEITAINSIDLGGNYGWNILSPLSRNLYWVGGGGNWNDEQNWSLVSGGIGGECIPSAYDNVFFDENSGFLTSGEIVFVNDERIYCNNMTWQGVENEPAFNSTLSSSINKLLIYGSFSLDSFMSIYFIGSIHFRAFEVGKAIKLSGKVIDGPVYFEGLGEWEFQDDFTVTRDMEQKSGSIRTLGNKVSVGKLLATSGSLYLYDSEVYIKKGRYYSRSEFLDAGTSHIIFTDSQSELNGSSIAHHTFYRVTFNNFLGRVSHCNIASKVEYKIGSGVYRGSVGNYVKSIEFDGFGKVEGDGIEFDTATFHSSGDLLGSNSYTIIQFSAGKTYSILGNSIQKILPTGSLIATSFGGFPIEIKSTQLGSQATIHKDGAPICLDYLYLTDIAFTGSSTAYAGANSDDVFNNSGWIFDACPPCVSSPDPAPILDPASITSVQCNGEASLILGNLPAGYEAVWFDADQSVELYASESNLYELFVFQNTTFYGATRDLATGCLSELLEVQVTVVNTPPVAICQNLTIQLGSGECEAILEAAQIDAGSNDDCGIPTLAILPIECPIGSTSVTLTVTDSIGQATTCTATVTVLELSNPSSSLVCNDLVIVSLENTCSGCQLVSESLEGGPYHCFDDYVIEVDRTPPFGNGPWVQSCFSSTDFGKTYQYRVTDTETGNKCWGNVRITESILPVCTPPPSIAITCEQFDPSLETYKATVSDNCCLNPNAVYQGQIGLIHTANYQLFDSVCNLGTLNRTFTAIDCGGNSSTCTQQIVVSFMQEYYVRFPNDTLVQQCNVAGEYGDPVIWDLACGIFGATHEDENLPLGSGGCYQIERTWKVLNWCTYNPNIGCDTIPNPMPETDPNHLDNFSGPIVSSCNASGLWAATNTKITPSDPSPTNFCNFWSADANCYLYTQHIVVNDTEQPLLTCPDTFEVVLDNQGLANVSVQDVGVSYSDNCTSENNLTVLAFQPFSFNCADQGSQTSVSVQVFDQCNNGNDCEIIIKVLPTLICGSVIGILDPCSCLNNATNLDNGQFYETVLIQSAPGKTWTLVANTGLYDVSSPAPPASPVLIPTGATFVEQPSGSGLYYLEGKHVDNMGYSIIAVSETNDTLSIGNQCAYPNPVLLSNLSDVFCPFDAPVPLLGDPGDPFIESAQFLIRGATIEVYNATHFYPSYGPGTYEIWYQVNGGSPKENGHDDPGCYIELLQTVMVGEYPTLICPQDITTNTDPGLCTAIVNGLTPLIDSNDCSGELFYRIDGIPGLFTGDASGFEFPIGSRYVNYEYRVNGQYAANCSVRVTVQDLEAPVLTCQSINLTTDLGVCTHLVSGIDLDPIVQDNCPGPYSRHHNFAPAPHSNTLNGAILPVGVSNIIWTAIDQSGNQSTCLQTILVEDLEAPVFLNCTGQMVMVGNDPNQCSAKINWTAPAAIDNCGVPTIQQILGPSSGSVLTVNCPAGPTLVSYQVTDAYGNSAECSFEIMVVDTESPQFDADIVMPGNTTVDCDAVPDNLVYHGLTLRPLTPDDVSDNCTPSADLNIQFAEQSTQSSDPATCGYYTFALTRTWTITDCAGNSLLHQQLIQVQDTTKPVAICLRDTVALNDFGQVVIDAADLAGSSYDNCASGFLSFSAGQTTITCADLSASPLQILVTVADPCGNTSTCFALVDVTEGNGKCTPEYDFSGSDPCVCLDNATNQDNGQFSELIQIHALAGQTWTVLSSAGLYLSTSPAPPVVPAPVPNGAMLTNGSSDGIDNDGDNQTDELDERVYYTLRAKHVDGQGYSAILRNAQGNQIQLENKCYYPSPYFTDELFADEPLCLGSAPVTIKVAEYNNAAGQIVPGSVMVNGLPTSVFDASALGLGAHTIMATFDAGMAQPFLRVNGMVVEGSEAEAIADPGCKQKITKVVNVVETPTALICDDLVYVAIDEDCQESLNPDEVLEGTYFCLDDYKVEVDKTLPYGNGPWVTADLNAADIGKQYQYRVVRITGSANVCWGEIKIEDKVLPSLDCPADVTITCSESTDLSHTGNVLVTDCSAYTTIVDDVFEDNGECGSPRGHLHRTWLVTDTWGNQAACNQLITLEAFDLLHVDMPADLTVDCETAYLNPAATGPNVTGRPSINGAPIGSGGYCAASISYTDERFDICSGSYSIHRTWKVSHECLPLGPNNPVVHIQRIRVKDFGGPAFVCPPAVTVSTNPYECCATAALPKMIVSEGCSNISNLEAKVTGINPINGNTITFTVGGHLEDFPGNNYWNPDTLAVFDYTQCMPLGDYTIQYKAQDDCSNISYCQFILTVADLTPPAVSCDQVTQVALTADGVAVIPADNLNDGTTDNCCLDFFEVRRMDGGDCTGTDFAPDVQFCCSDIGDTVMVVFRAWDCHGNYNDCMVSVLVEDKIKPACQPPANVSVNCENFDPSLWTYGIPDVADNCCLDNTKTYQGQIGLTHSVNYSLFDTVCNKGTITRTFRAFDCSGNSSQCTQRVFVNYLQDYYVKFPNDAIVTTCDGTGNFGEPLFFGEDCELLGVSHTDEIFTVVPDACFKIERTWQIINWCTFNPNLPLIEVPNPNPNPVSNAAANLPGPTVSACGTIAPWAPTVVKINPTDLTATNYCTFWQQDANGYKYKQIIKIQDGQAPTGTFVEPTCDNQAWNTANRSDLWNEMYWWDNGIQTHDLCEEPTELSITGTDACSGANVNIEYLLFLDLDGDGTMETVVNSVNTGLAGLGWNNVLYNNLNTPNFSGGTPRAFDERPVPTNQKYGFAIQETVVGTNKTATVRWNTQQQQNNYVVPELPHGTHKIKWFITDGCGNNSEYEYTFTVKDCKAPTVVCLNGLSVNIMPTSMIQLWATDFLQYTEDNCTPSGQIKVGIRKCGTGAGFPVDAQGNPITNVTFTCDELGTQCVELWAVDAQGNADYCETYVIVQDNLGNCPIGDHINVSGALKTEMTDGIEEATVNVNGTSTFTPPYSYFDLTDDNGNYQLINNVPLDATFTIAPEKDDNPLNGVTTYDLVLISKHILGLEPLNSPYKMIAADANKSGSITTFDIVEIRKLILGIYTELPNNTSWRFVDKAFVFPNPNNPFQSAFPETVSVANAMTTQFGKDFAGVKIGDVNSSAVANANMQAEERTDGTALFDIEDRDVKAGEEFEVTLRAAQQLKGFQFTMTLNGLTAVGVVNSDNVSDNNFNLLPQGAMAVSIDGAQAFTVRIRAEQSGKLSEMLGVSGAITRAEAYGEEGRMNVALRFRSPEGMTVSGVGFELYQNQPNPFLNKTSIGFFLPEAADATLSVFDETGRTMYQQKGSFAKGENAIVLDRALLNTTGVLFYQLETSNDRATRKMVQGD